jgi:hypothetical protein
MLKTYGVIGASALLNLLKTALQSRSPQNFKIIGGITKKTSF